MRTLETEKLIQRVADSSEPVRPLPRPWLRTAAWLALAAPYVALVVYVVSPRDDLIAKLWDLRYFIEQAAALVTGIAAAVAAFALAQLSFGVREREQIFGGCQQQFDVWHCAGASLTTAAASFPNLPRIRASPPAPQGS
jgi:hypothetical protein